MSEELILKDIYCDTLQVNTSKINDDTLIFYIPNEFGMAELDLRKIVKLRNFLNEFIEANNEK